MKNVTVAPSMEYKDMKEAMKLYDEIWEVFRRNQTKADMAYLILSSMADSILTMSLDPDLIMKINQSKATDKPSK